MSFWDSPITGTIINDFAFMEKRLVPDEVGSQKRIWAQGSIFTANVSKVSTQDQETAEARDSVALYKVTTKPDLILSHPDVIKRLSDGRYFLIKSDGTDMVTPDSSTLDMRIVMATDWHIPAGDEVE